MTSCGSHFRSSFQTTLTLYIRKVKLTFVSVTHFCRLLPSDRPFPCFKKIPYFGKRGGSNHLDSRNQLPFCLIFPRYDTDLVSIFSGIRNNRQDTSYLPYSGIQAQFSNEK